MTRLIVTKPTYETNYNMSTPDEDEISDEDLMRSYMLGDLDSFEILYSRHAGRLYGYLRRRLAAGENIDDVFQETLMRLHRSRNKYDPKMPFLPWLFTICHNTLVDHVRKNRSSEKIAEELRSSDAYGELGLRLEPRADFLRLGLRHLSDDERRLLSLRFVEDMPFREVADTMGIQPANARKLSSRAIQKLRAFFKNDR